MTLLTQLAFSLLWIPYVWGGNVPHTGLDCSGTVLVPLKKVGIIPEKYDLTSQSIHDYLLTKKFSSCEPQEDCILFFGKSSKRITHVAIAIDEKRMIGARGGNHTTKNIAAAIKRKAWVDFTEISRRKDLVACIKVEY